MKLTPRGNGDEEEDGEDVNEARMPAEVRVPWVSWSSDDALARLLILAACPLLLLKSAALKADTLPALSAETMSEEGKSSSFNGVDVDVDEDDGDNDRGNSRRGGSDDEV